MTRKRRANRARDEAQRTQDELDEAQLDDVSGGSVTVATTSSSVTTKSSDPTQAAAPSSCLTPLTAVPGPEPLSDLTSQSASKTTDGTKSVKTDGSTIFRTSTIKGG